MKLSQLFWQPFPSLTLQKLSVLVCSFSHSLSGTFCTMLPLCFCFLFFSFCPSVPLCTANSSLCYCSLLFLISRGGSGKLWRVESPGRGSEEHRGWQLLVHEQTAGRHPGIRVFTFVSKRWTFVYTMSLWSQMFKSSHTFSLIIMSHIWTFWLKIYQFDWSISKKHRSLKFCKNNEHDISFFQKDSQEWSFMTHWTFSAEQPSGALNNRLHLLSQVLDHHYGIWWCYIFSYIHTAPQWICIYQKLPYKPSIYGSKSYRLRWTSSCVCVMVSEMWLSCIFFQPN